jgi:hypothetical protein
MTVTVQKNQKNGVVTIHFNASGSIVIAGNNSVSNVAIGAEIIETAPINQVWAGSPSGNAAYWEIKRDGTLVATIDSTCYLDFAGNGNQLTVAANGANLTANLIGATSGFLVVELQKLGAGGRPPLGANSDYFVAGQ